jgi:hypothetical protein
MRYLFDRAAYWLADNYSSRDLVVMFGTLCFFAGLLLGLLVGD